VDVTVDQANAPADPIPLLRTARPNGTKVVTTRRFEWTFIVLVGWLLSGGYLDAWAHRHFTFETFFTPWHAVLYSGMFSVLVFLAVNTLRNQAKGEPLTQALPDGYGLSLVGCMAFGVSGTIDMVWHLRFGIEKSLAALVSPPHLLLMTSLALIVAGPLRAAWRRPVRVAPWTAIVSAAMLLSMFTFFDQFDQPLVNAWSSVNVTKPVLDYVQQLGILGIMVQSALLTGTVLYLLSRFKLPFGSIAVIAGVNGIFLGVLQTQFQLIPVAVIGGLLADFLVLWLKPGLERVTALRVGAFLGPVGVSSLYILVVAVTLRMTWPITLWLGAIFVSGAIGLLLSYLLVRPPVPEGLTG
jgi:hypothetical protein